MNRILLALLVASVGLNAWLAFSSIRVTPANAPVAAPDHQAKPAAAKEALASASAAEKTSADAARPFVWKNPGNSPEALRELAANLRAAGVPPAIVGRIIGETLRAQLFADIARLPHWQLMAPNKETRRRQSEAARELLRLQEEIAGPAGSPVKNLDPTQRRLDYGDLPDDKVTALLRIQRDYDDLRNDLFATMGGGIITREEADARRKEQEHLEKERLADVAAALTPEEFAEYERRQSPAAQRAQRSLRDLNLTEDAYLSLLALEKARDPYNNNFVGSLGTVTPEKLAYMDQVRATLGDAQANTYLKSADFNYGMVARFAEKYPAITPAQTYELYKLQGEAQAALRGPDGGGVRDIGKLQATMSDLNARLDKLVGPAAAEAYRKQGSGMVFSSFRPSSPPAATPPKG
ncbi:MAG: hypothetical protein HZA32_09020 [Opitutae bacterium]|nr:hypothetical protein [Opitutae bacterium]